MGVIGRQFYDQQLARRFRHHWRSRGEEEDAFKIRLLELSDVEAAEPDGDVLLKLGAFLRSDHGRFWFANHRDYFASFKSVLITDTGKKII